MEPTYFTKFSLVALATLLLTIQATYTLTASSGDFSNPLLNLTSDPHHPVHPSSLPSFFRIFKTNKTAAKKINKLDNSSAVNIDHSIVVPETKVGASNASARASQVAHSVAEEVTRAVPDKVVRSAEVATSDIAANAGQVAGSVPGEDTRVADATTSGLEDEEASAETQSEKIRRAAKSPTAFNATKAEEEARADSTSTVSEEILATPTVEADDISIPKPSKVATSAQSEKIRRAAEFLTLSNATRAEKEARADSTSAAFEGIHATSAAKAGNTTTASSSRVTRQAAAPLDNSADSSESSPTSDASTEDSELSPASDASTENSPTSDASTEDSELSPTSDASTEDSSLESSNP